MKKLPRWLTILLVLLLLGFLGGATVFYFFNFQPDSAITKKFILPVLKPTVDFLSGFKKHADVEGAKPEFILTAEEFYADFQNDQQQAGAKYNGKIVQVNGAVASVTAHADTNIVILLSIPADPASNISCQMDPRYSHLLQNTTAGNAISIKGICNGSKKDDLLGSLDILLNRCVVVQ